MAPSSNKGFSLIEVLVSVFVLTVGVIAASGLHLTALHTAQQSALQTRAIHLAVELAESMRTDLSTLSEHVIALQDDDCMTATGGCDNHAFASDDMGKWLQRVAQELPAGQARICQDASPWDSASERLSWSCSSGDATAKGPFVIKIGWHDKASKREASIDSPKLALVVQSIPQ